MTRALEFLVRVGVGVTVVFLLCQPLLAPMLALVARGAESLLAWTWSPPLVTELRASGDMIHVRGILFGPDQWMGRFSAANVPIFLIAAVGIAVTAPSRDLPGRLVLVAGTLAASFAVMVAVTAIEALAVAANWAMARWQIVLLSEPQRGCLEYAAGWIDTSQMVLPATVALIAYRPAWLAGQWTTRSTPRRHAWLAWGALALLMAGVTLPVRLPVRGPWRARLERTAARNPDSAEAWLALAAVRLHETDGPGAVAAYRRALAAGADKGAVRMGMVQSLLAQGRPAEALALAEAPLPGVAPSAALLVATGRALMRLGRPCEALARLRHRAEASFDPSSLRRTRARAERACRRAPPAGGVG